jgi:tetrahydromethanopterin S-methyltransferase subunit D
MSQLVATRCLSGTACTQLNAASNPHGLIDALLMVSIALSYNMMMQARCTTWLRLVHSRSLCVP